MISTGVPTPLELRGGMGNLLNLAPPTEEPVEVSRNGYHQLGRTWEGTGGQRSLPQSRLPDAHLCKGDQRSGIVAKATIFGKSQFGPTWHCGTQAPPDQYLIKGALVREIAVRRSLKA